MIEQRWRPLWEIYDAACEMAPEARHEFVYAGLQDPEAAARVIHMLDRLDSGSFSTGWQVDASDSEWSHAGETIGRFRISGPLGRGGAGEVYSALDLELDRIVALKFLVPGHVGSQANLQLFIREAQAASALNHPGIVTVHDVLHAGESVAIVMELVDGVPLRSKCGVANPVAEVADWGRQVSLALAVAHSRGIAHRDIKPENLMLRPDGLVKILDFGLARQVETDAPQNATAWLPAGTLRYMSPEQKRGEPLTAASDVFSLGLVLRELVMGSRPSVARSSVAFDALITAMLAERADKRPGAADVATSLGEILKKTRRSAREYALAAAGIALAALVTFTSLQLWLAERPPSGHPVSLRSAPLTGLGGDEVDAAFSPAGDQICYGWDGPSPGVHNIYVTTIGRQDRHRLTSEPWDNFNPVWSPDGRQIAFLRRGTNTFQIVTVPAQGGPLRQVGVIRSSPMAMIRMKFITWSPDGKELIVSDLPAGKQDNLHLYRMLLSTGERRVIGSTPDTASDIAPAFSPDGRSLAFLRWARGAAYELHIMEHGMEHGTDAGSSRTLLTSPTGIFSFSWTADSRRIIYATAPSGPDRLWQVSARGGTSASAPFTLPGDVQGLAIAPREHRLLYLSVYQDANIWRLDAARHKLRLLMASTRRDTDPSYSPDGSKIAFSSSRSGNFEIWVCASDGSNPRQLTSTGTAGSPSWSPDGRRIAFDTQRGSGSVILAVDAAGGPARDLLSDRSEAFIPSWSSDGRSIYFSSHRSGSPQIWKAPAAGGPASQLTHDGGFEAMESRDGRFVYFTKNDDHSTNSPDGIWRMPVAGGAQERVEATRLMGRHRYWALANDGLYFLNTAAGAQLRFLNFASQRVSTVGKFDKPPAPFQRGLSVTPDGRFVLYVQIDQSRQEIMLANDFR